MIGLTLAGMIVTCGALFLGYGLIPAAAALGAMLFALGLAATAMTGLHKRLG